MFSRALRKGYAVPIRRQPLVGTQCIPRRAVTTDAASSHAEREKVPEVG